MDDEIEFHEVDRGRWRDVEGLFDSRGGPKYCWCMVWRNMPAGVPRGDNEAKKEALRGRVQQGEDIGILGYLKEEVVGWCSVALRDTYRVLGGPADAPGENVWSIVCFFVPRRLRMKGVARGLVRAAVDYAREKGQRWLRPILSPPTPQATASWGSSERSNRWVFGKWGEPGSGGT